MSIQLFSHQQEALEKLETGSILCGGVGSGKSRTAIAYYYVKECKGNLETLDISEPKDLYIITTAKKRDSCDWERELMVFNLSKVSENNPNKINITIDSWNNIGKYLKVHNSFFIFDEQRVVGAGAWVKSFIKITRENHWILLSATPGDTWLDYIPVFIANGFYRNRTDFITQHVVYEPFNKYRKVHHYVNCGKLIKYRNRVVVPMIYKKETMSHYENIQTDYDKLLYKDTLRNRWNYFTDEPIKDINGLCFALRKICNLDKSKIERLYDIYLDKKKLIVFYNFNYELDFIKSHSRMFDCPIAEYNGHQHQEVPTGDKWIYLVQYNAGAEGWECIETDTIVFYSQSYSYKMQTQAAGRINRLNTPFYDLYYYTFSTSSSIDSSIKKALSNKRNFNESMFDPNQKSQKKHSL